METIDLLLKEAKQATSAIRGLCAADRAQLLRTLSTSLWTHRHQIIRANEQDLARMDSADAKYDRLWLNEGRIQALADSLLAVSALADPTGQVLSTKTLDNGLQIIKRTVPLGVVGVIYESRPNVTVDVAALCIMSGNVCVLRGGSDAWHTNAALVALIHALLLQAGLPTAMVQLLPPDRALVGPMLQATAYIDIIIPRGSQSLIEFVRANATVPVIETGAGVCHTYVEASADLDQAVAIVANAKISRPSVCNALDTVLVDSTRAHDFLTLLAPLFEAAAVDVYADEAAFEHLNSLAYPYLHKAAPQDFGREFLALKCSMKVVSTMEEALTHIERYSSKHSECIVSTDSQKIETFMLEVDAAAVYANASTRFTDGGEFGLGAEIGISTQKLHARGPFALEKLVTEKWFIHGQGQVR